MALSNATCSDISGCISLSSISEECRPGYQPDVPPWTYVLIILLLVLSGLFSGLNLGLMSLDNIGLEIIMGSGNENEKKYAKGLAPLRKQGNLLLCTLLLGNTAVNALLAILMADLTGGIIGAISTTFGIVIFGEIIPQSVCSRNGLAVGYYTRYIVIGFMALLWIVAAPISWILDYILEEEIGNVYTRDQMMKLFEVHAGQKYGDLVTDEVTILKGVLQLAKKTVRDIMTPMDQVFMLDINSRMDYKSMARILSKGHSRIPVYDGDIDNIYKLLLVKNMIMLNPGDEVPLRSLLQEGFPEPLYVSPDITLDQMLNEFQMGGSHLAVVCESQVEFKAMDGKGDGADVGAQGLTKVTKRKNLGIVTLEDVIETLIQEPIADETEGPANQNIGQKFLKVLRKKNKFKSSSLTSSEGRAIASFLQGMFDPFRPGKLGSRAVENLVQSSEIIQLKPEATGTLDVYTEGEPANFCCLVLDGSLRITVGIQRFRSEAGIWKMLALHSLTEEKYIADFTATVIKECTILKICREDYRAAIEGKNLVNRHSESMGKEDGTEVERKGLIGKFPQLPTVNALRKQYGNEVEFEEELKANRGAGGVDTTQDLKKRSKSAGFVDGRESKFSRLGSSGLGDEHMSISIQRGSVVNEEGGGGDIALMPVGGHSPQMERIEEGRGNSENISGDSEVLLTRGRTMSDEPGARK
mmetsp:Transcript_26218/g.46507  ORF Transcript_26218/g.46507 Transcript_26218/m.46507 type:complete len:697 (-) Transcript_26218:272-2362(-)